MARNFSDLEQRGRLAPVLKGLASATRTLGARLQGVQPQVEKEDDFERQLMLKQLEREQKLDDLEQAHQYKLAQQKAKGISTTDMTNYIQMQSALNDPATPEHVKLQIRRFLNSQDTPDEVTELPQGFQSPQGMQVDGTLPTEVSQGTSTGGYQKIPTGKIDKFGRPEFKLEKIEGKGGFSKEQQKDLSKRLGEGSRVVNALYNLRSEHERATESFGPTGGKAAITYDVGRMRYAPDFLKEAAVPLQAAEAQTKEVTIAMLPILSGQARYVQSLAENIAKTVPGVDVLPETRDDLLKQSTRNMMTLIFAIKNGFLSANKLIAMGIDPESEITDESEAAVVLQGVKLKPEERAAIDNAIEYVLSAQASSSAGDFMTQRGAVPEQVQAPQRQSNIKSIVRID